MCETESHPRRQQLQKPSSHVYAANLEERTENECEIEMGNINSGGAREGSVQLAIRCTVYREESAAVPVANCETNGI